MGVNIDNYQPPAGGHDEMRSAAYGIRPHWRDFMEAFAGLAPRPAAPALPEFVPLLEEHIVTEARADAHQAQVYQGWYAPRLGAPEQAATAVMNTILGGAGLSSRLFTELRDKQGLAYSVRSAYVAMGQAGELQLAIGTSPGNIGRALLGFTEQLHRIREEPVSIEELQAAKGRLNGTFVMSHETNRQRCVDLAINHILGLGPDYSEVLLQRTTAVTVPDVQAAAQHIAPPAVTAIVAGADALAALEEDTTEK